MKKNTFALIQTFKDLIFPRNCFGCESPLNFYEKRLCLSCQIQLPLTSFHFTHKNPLFQKLNLQFETMAATSLFFFQKEGVLSNMIHLFKYKGVKKIGYFLGDWLANCLLESTFFKNIEGIVPVPLHSKKAKIKRVQPSRNHRSCAFKKNGSSSL